jgi:hypothetical protein
LKNLLDKTLFQSQNKTLQKIILKSLRVYNPFSINLFTAYGVTTLRSSSRIISTSLVLIGFDRSPEVCSGIDRFCAKLFLNSQDLHAQMWRDLDKLSTRNLFRSAKRILLVDIDIHLVIFSKPLGPARCSSLYLALNI